MRLTEARRAELIGELRDLVRRYESEDGGDAVTLSIAAYPEAG